MKVGLGEELEEGVVAKNVDEGDLGKMVVGGEVGVGDGKNGEGGAVREIRDEGRGKHEIVGS